MKQLTSILADTKASGVYLVSTKPSVEDLRTLCNKHDLTLFYLSEKAIRTKNQFLDYVAKIFDFPDYFGRNWDALEDCLKDMDWAKANGFLILYEHFEAFAENEPKQFDQALDIFKEVAEYWQDKDTIFTVLLHSEAPTEKMFVTIVS